MTGLAAGRPRQACTKPAQDPSNDTRDRRDIPQQQSRVRRRAESVHPTPDRCEAPSADTAAEDLWRSPTGARYNRGQTNAIRLVANQRRTTAAASLPLHMAARNGTDRSRRAPRHRTGASDTATPRLILAIRYMLSRCEPKTTCVMSRSAATLMRTGLSALCSAAHPSARSPLAIRQRVAVRPYAQPIPRASDRCDRGHRLRSRPSR